jgi:5S rRNA maturation endonuclease (ribonuclease M5)
MSAYARVTEALNAHGSKGRGNAWQCVAHEDRSPSLSVTNAREGVLLNCHAGCATEDVVGALGLTMADLFDEPLQKQERPQVVAEYPYCDRHGEVLKVVRRIEPGYNGEKKTFRQFKPDGTPGTKDIPNVLYRLPEVLATAEAGGLIYVVEGEKDVENLRALGLTATCNIGGAGKWASPYCRFLEGAGEVVVIADRDEPGRKHAEAVAKSVEQAGIPVRILEPARGKDVSDHIAAGLEFDDLVPATRTAPAQNDSSNSSEPLWGPEEASAGIDGTENEGGGPCWDDPLPVPRHTLPPFPTELLGTSLAAWVRAQGASLNVSDDLLALSALGTISAALGGRVQVKVKDGWEAENVCLYCLGLADSSARKTPALDAASAPMRDRIGQLREDHRAEVEQVEQEIRITEKELAAVENDVSRSKATKGDARAVLDTLLELKAQPGLPKAFVGDVTLEALGKVMGENGGRMALHESEAGFFKACAGLYGNGRADITLVLKAYSGTGHEIDRVGRGHSWMPRTALTLTLIIQPGVVEHMEKDNPEFKSSGFLNRFLYALPSPMPPGAFDTPDVPLDVSLDYAQRIVRLVDDVWTNENIRTLTLTAQARKVFAEFYNQTEKDKADGGALHDVAEWAGKLCGQIIRLAACLSLYDNAAASEIGEDAMTRTIGLAPYLTAHARAAFGLMSRDGDGGRKLLRDILDRLPQLLADDMTVTTRKIRESFKGRRASGSAGAVDAEVIKDAMDELQELGWVAEIPAPPRKPGQRGQKPSPKYDVHPWIYDPPEEAA